MKISPVDIKQRLSYIVGAARDYKAQYIDDGQDEFYELVNKEVEGPIWEWLEKEVVPIANVSEELAHNVIKQTVSESCSAANEGAFEDGDDIEDYKSQAYFDHGLAYAKFIFEISHHADVLYREFCEELKGDFLLDIDKLVLGNEADNQILKDAITLLNKEELKLLRLALYSAYLGKQIAKSKELEDKLFWVQMRWDMSLEKQAFLLAS